MTKLQVKWRITGLDNIIVTPDEKVYQLPYESMGRSFVVREIKPKGDKGVNYYRINGKRYTLQKLHSLTYESIETLQINDPTVTSLPFSIKAKLEEKIINE